jgi:hypothetical protein
MLTFVAIVVCFGLVPSVLIVVLFEIQAGRERERLLHQPSPVQQRGDWNKLHEKF